eukprot:TRINITY_DN9376_c1_g2_i1.p1 TRINITY_DN9376_c1_g2~~TRINITY_DN9376_c1_g2_i1.p1  ORF type:complete len:241 (+),score=56.94 TRINITY_DN9376_c1_g2_i1:100-822(+)
MQSDGPLLAAGSSGHRLPPKISKARGRLEEAHTPPRKPRHVVKAVVVGRPGAGTSSLLSRYEQRDEYSPPEGDGPAGEKPASTTHMILKSFLLDGKAVKAVFWDPGDPEDERWESYVKGAHGLVLLFDVTDRSSFEHVTQTWVSDLRQLACPRARFIVVGTKCDVDEESREVPAIDGEELARSIDAEYYECSASSGDGVADALESLVVIMCDGALGLQPALGYTGGNKKSSSFTSCCTVL